MMNIEQITARLAKLPDQALQQYAAMHKNDPYIIALAVSESNRRKQMRQAAQGAQGEMEQPTVVDQDIAEMAPAPVAPQQMMPEDTGIAQLPVGEMEFAGGGIVAFADGGDVERYQFGGATSALRSFLQATGQTSAYVNGTPAEKAAIEAAFRATIQGPMPAAPAPATPSSPATARPLPSPGALGAAARVAPIAGIPVGIAAGLTSAMEDMRAQGYPVDPAGEFSTGAATPEQAAFDAARVQRVNEARGTTPQRTETPSARLNAERAQNMAVVNQDGFTRPAMANDPRMLAGALAEIDASNTRSVGQSGGPGAGGPGAGGPGTTPARAAAPGMDIPAMISRELSAAEQKENPFAAAVMQLGQDRISAKEAEVRGLEAIQKQFDNIYKGRKERLDTREGELGKMKDQYTGLALLQAGATMMSTTGGIGKALGKGVQVGSEQYAAGLGKLQAAKDKIVEARDRLEEIESQRNELSARELNKARNEVKQTGISAREDLIKSNMQMYGVNRETAMKLVEMQVRVGTTQMENASRERVAAMSAAAAARNPQLEVLRAITSDPKLLQTYQAMHGSKSSIMDEYTKFLKENPTLMGDEQKALAAFLRAKGVLGGGGAGAAAAGQGDGTVLPRKD
jgi:hypothetical protein